MIDKSEDHKGKYLPLGKKEEKARLPRSVHPVIPPDNNIKRRLQAATGAYTSNWSPASLIRSQTKIRVLNGRRPDSDMNWRCGIEYNEIRNKIWNHQYVVTQRLNGVRRPKWERGLNGRALALFFFPSFLSINRRANGCMDGLTNGRTGNTSFRVICTRHEREINVLHLLPLDSNNSVEYLKKRLQVLRFSEVDGSRRDYDRLKRSRSRKWLYNCEDWSAVGVKSSPISSLRKK